MPGNLPVTRTELDVASLPQQDGRFADYAYQLYSAPADLTVTLINYGERQPAAETVEIRLSRGITGEERFSTTNGNALFSESGLLLLLHDSFLPIVIDAVAMRAWHYPIADRTFLLGAKWDGEQFVATTLAYGKTNSAAETFGPWRWEEITNQWQPGVGKWASRKTTN